MFNYINNAKIHSPDTELCGYTVPHPSEYKINFRVQVKGQGFQFAYIFK